MIIRFMKKEDISQVAMLHLASWQKAFRGILSDGYLDNLIREQFEEIWGRMIEMSNRTNLVAEKYGIVIGFIAFGPIREISNGKGDIGEVYGIYVHPAQWRTGTGKKLLTIALKELKDKGFKKVCIWTMKDNDIARGFYEKLGFILTNEKRISKREEEEFSEVMYEIMIK